MAFPISLMSQVASASISNGPDRIDLADIKASSPAMERILNPLYMPKSFVIGNTKTVISFAPDATGFRHSSEGYAPLPPKLFRSAKRLIETAGSIVGSRGTAFDGQGRIELVFKNRDLSTYELGGDIGSLFIGVIDNNNDGLADYAVVGVRMETGAIIMIDTSASDILAKFNQPATKPQNVVAN